MRSRLPRRMTAARINHSTVADQEEVIGRYLEAADAAAPSPSVDPRAPRSRLRFVDDQEGHSQQGDEFTITIEDVLSTVKRLHSTFKGSPAINAPVTGSSSTTASFAVRRGCHRHRRRQ